MASGRYPLPTGVTEPQSQRSQEDEELAASSRRFEVLQNTILDESENSATHTSSETTDRPISPAHSKRKAPLASDVARRRLRSNVGPHEQPVAGPSRLTQPYSGRREPDVLTTEGTADTNAADVVSSTGRSYSPPVALLYADDGPSPCTADNDIGHLTTPRDHNWSDNVAHRTETIMGLRSSATQLTAEASSSSIGSMSLARMLKFDEEERPSASPASAQLQDPSPQPAESSSRNRIPPKLSGYNCPICFSPPTYATMTPCGHVCCAECLFTAVKTSIQRSMYHGPASSNAKCPVCRASIPGWDGKGGGVIGLKTRLVHDISGSPTKSTS